MSPRASSTGTVSRPIGPSNDTRCERWVTSAITDPWESTTLPRVVPLESSRCTSSPETDMIDPSVGGSPRKSKRIFRLTGHIPAGAPIATTCPVTSSSATPTRERTTPAASSRNQGPLAIVSRPRSAVKSTGTIPSSCSAPAATKVDTSGFAFSSIPLTTGRRSRRQFAYAARVSGSCRLPSWAEHR